MPSTYKSNIWREIRRKKEKVKWYRLLWHSLNVPKNSVIKWLAKLDRLPTKGKLKVTGLNVDEACMLCGAARENQNHLFLIVFSQRKFGSRF